MKIFSGNVFQMCEQIIIFPHYQNDCKSIDELISRKKWHISFVKLKEAIMTSTYIVSSYLGNKDDNR